MFKKFPVYSTVLDEKEPAEMIIDGSITTLYLRDEMTNK